MVEKLRAPASAALTVTLVGNHACWMEAFVDHFRRDEVEITLVHDGAQAVSAIEKNQPGLVIFDTDHLDAPLLEVCRRARAVSDGHITIYCSSGGESVVIAGFAAGADDVLIGHHSSRELAARIRAVARRRKRPAPHTNRRGEMPWRYICGSLTIDVTRREVRLAGIEVHLTRTQFAILVELVRHGGAVTTREDLAEAVWGPKDRANLESITMHVGQLRRKLGEDADRPAFIHSVRGVGYRLGPSVRSVESAL